GRAAMNCSARSCSHDSSQLVLVETHLVVGFRGAGTLFRSPLLTWSATRPTVARTRPGVLAEDGEERAPTCPKEGTRTPRADSVPSICAIEGREPEAGRPGELRRGRVVTNRESLPSSGDRPGRRGPGLP